MYSRFSRGQNGPRTHNKPYNRARHGAQHSGAQRAGAKPIGAGHSSAPRAAAGHSGGQRSGFNNNRSNTNRSLSRRQKTFHPSLFIKKAEQMVEQPVFVPQHQFNDFPFHEDLKRNIREKGFVQPTPIQDGVIPPLLEGRDVIGIANTGTGKTAAFLLPLINKIMAHPFQKALVIAPTRELAIQIEDELRQFAKNLNIISVVCIGGANIKRQSDQLRRKHHFVIATPGRLIDLEKRGTLKFDAYSSIVLDEVDRMLDMGFIHDMKYIIARLPQRRHSLFFSATLPDSMVGLMNSFLTDPITISVKKPQETSSNVDQDVVQLNGRNRIEVLHDLLITEGFSKVLIFGRTKHGMNKLSKELVARGFKVAAIHGNKSQTQRQAALNMFKDNRIQILLATDIASRGLDIDDITHVINYDLPVTYEDYIHRIGRTGRANKKGYALTFID